MSDKLSDDVYQKLMCYIKDNISQCNGSRVVSADFLTQVYDELNIIEDTQNVYNNFVSKLKENYDIKNLNIVEVGCGVLPRLAYRLIEEVENGLVYAYDPKLSIYAKKFNNLILKQEKFSKDCCPKNVDLIVALHPCDGVFQAVECASLLNVDFFYKPCKCIHENQMYLDFLKQNQLDNNEYIYRLFIRMYILKSFTSTSFNVIDETSNEKTCINNEYIYTKRK